MQQLKQKLGYGIFNTGGDHMENSLVMELERAFKKCSDCGLHPEYVVLLNRLYDIALSEDLIAYLCDKVTSKRHIWEIRFDHLRILLLNPSARRFDLKAFYLENLKRSRRLAMKLFYIRGYAMYATEDELNPVMEKFCRNMEKLHDYIDFNYILSVAGLPYLAETYGYPCFVKGLETAKTEHEKIDPRLRGYFTLNEKLEQINCLPVGEIRKKMEAFLNSRRNAQ